jgi:hypothetical protein
MGWVGRGAAERGRAGRPASAAGGAGPMAGAEQGGARRGWCVRAGGARPRQTGPAACACCAVGPGWGRHEVAEGLGQQGIGEGRRGEMGPARATGRGTAEAGGAGGQHALWGRAGRPARSRGKAGLGRGRAGHGEQAAGHRRKGRAGKNEKRAGFTNWAKEHNDPPYVPQLPDLAEEHKLLCYPPYVPRLVDLPDEHKSLYSSGI